MLKHYRDSFFLKLINIILEYAIILFAYYISGDIRAHIPNNIAHPFSAYDITTFSKFAQIGALFAVIVYLCLGSYSTIHFVRIQAELTQIMIVQLLVGSVISASLYWSDGWQFSRVWLALFVLISMLMIFIKRLALHLGTDLLLSKHLAHDKVLIIGNNDLARRFLEGAQKNRKFRYDVIGYMADDKNAKMHGYLGTPSDLYNYLNDVEVVQMIVISEENCSRKQLQEILYICSIYDIRAYILPMFNDYMLGSMQRTYREDVSGIHLIEINVMDTDNILGVNIAVTNMEKAIEDISNRVDEWRGEYICVSNVHTTVMAHDDENYRKIQNSSVMSLPDGGPLSAHSRSNGTTAAQRVTGPDLMREILSRSGEHGWRHFFYGSSEKTLAALKEKVEERYPGAVIAGMISPPFRQLTPEEDAAFVALINEAKPDFIWVGLGAPKQEIWMAAHQGKVDALMIGVGAAFDYESGNIKRAPMWMQKLSLEWLYRLLQDPKRLFRRYFVTNIKYMWMTRK